MLGFGSVSIGNLVAHIGADITGLDRGLARARGKLKSFGKSMTRIGRSMSLALTVPILAAGVTILKTAGDFEAAMNRVQALTGATGESLSELTSLAKDLGITTQFSASQAASGIEILAKNGIKAQDILDGMLTSSLNLAAATGTDLKSAADIATDAMLQFNRTAADMPNIMDSITNTTTNSKFGIDDYAFALASAGGVAGQVGVEFDDFNAAIIATASNFKSGRRAGTSLKSFLTRLVPVGKQAKEMMEKLNLEFFDSTGAIKPMTEIAGELNRVFKNMTDEQKLLTGQVIFGTDAIRTALGLAEQGFEGVAEAMAKIEKEGTAVEQAEARMKGFNGAMKRFISALEGLKIAIGESGFLKWATDFVESAAEMTRELAAVNPEIFILGLKIAGVVATIGPALIVFGFLAAAVAAILSPIGLLVTALVGGGGLIASFILWKTEAKDLPDLLAGVAKGASSLWDTLTSFPRSVIDYFIELRMELAKTKEEIKDVGGETVWEELGAGALKWGQRVLSVFSLIGKGFGLMVSKKIAQFGVLLKFMIDGLLRTKKIIISLGTGDFKKALEIAKQPALNLKTELKAIYTTNDNSIKKALKEFKEDWKAAGTFVIPVTGKVTGAGETKKKTVPTAEGPILAPGESATPFNIQPLSAEEIAELLNGVEVGKEAAKARKKIMEEGKLLTMDVRTEQETYNDELKRYDDLLTSGAITTETYNRAVQKLTDNLTSEATIFTKVWQGAFKGVEDSAAGFFTVLLGGTESSFSDILDSFKRMMDQLVSQAIAADLMQTLFGASSATGGLKGNDIGGLIGKGLGLFASAEGGAVTGPGESATPFFHKGGVVGLGQDEVPIVAQRGEGVFTRKQMAALSPAGEGEGTTVNMTVVTPDAKSFQHPRAQSQIQRQLAMSVNKGRTRT